jgi:hypothetical protein
MPKTTVPKRTRCPKCGKCGEDIDKSVDIEYKRKWYHQNCLDELQQEQNAKLDKEIIEKEDLYKYICELYGLTTITQKISKQIKDYHEQHGYKYSGMKLSLKYFYETKGNPVPEDAGVGIIPYVYEEAKKEFLLNLNAQKHNDNIDEPFVTEIEVKIKIPTCNSPMLGLLDMDTLLDGAEESEESKSKSIKTEEQDLIDMDNL